MSEMLKPGWTRVAFGEMVQHVAERVEPTPDDCETYIGLEHLDSGSLTVRRWGARVALIGTKLRMRKGDILFARRNAYLRRVAVAPHDGLFSAHGMIVRAKPSVVLPEFLPFFMQSDVFMDRAERISVGSLSPTINWKTLAQEEFALPPLEEQRRIAEVLGAIRTTYECHGELSRQIFAVTQALIAEFLYEAELSIKPSLLEEHADVSYGLTVDPSRRTAVVQIPYLRVANVHRGSLELSEVKSVGKKDGDDTYRLATGDVLIVEGHADVTQIGRAAVWVDEKAPMYHQNHLIRVRCSRHLNPQYLVYIVNAIHGQTYFRGHAKSTSGLNTINSTVVKRYPFPVPLLEVQTSFVERVGMGESQLRSIVQRQECLMAMSRTLLDQLRGDTQ